jgi:hypothetical protein
MNIDFSKVTAWQEYLRLNPALPDVSDAIEMRNIARAYIDSFRWCDSIKDDYVGLLFPGIVSVFLFNINPARPGVDDWMWVVVGDVPSAYIACEDAKNPAAALDAYIGAMEEWVAAARAGDDVKGLIPVNVSPSIESENRLQRRLEFLDSKILSMFQDDLND